MAHLAGQGRPSPLGVSLTPGGINIAVHTATATAIELCLFDSQDRETRIDLPHRTGDIFHAEISGPQPGDRYGLRAHGPWQPEAGHRFNPNKLLIDPHALRLDRIAHHHDSMLASNDEDSAAVMPKAIICTPQPCAPIVPLTPWDRTVIYEAHVRGLTMRHPDVPPRLRGTFAALAHPAIIAHLKALGVTTLELLPVAACISEPRLARLGLTNHWGYNSIAFAAPDPRLAPGSWDEIRTAVASLAEAGIETIIDIVLNHTGEGDADGTTLSLRGLDNANYFLADRTDPWTDANHTGCGNTLALNNPAPLRLAMDALRAWARFGGVHGFRFDLATVLGRMAQGFTPHAPLLAAIAQDPLLAPLKLIAEPWDIGPGGWQTGQFPPGWAEWNDHFRDDLRKFWRSTPASLGPLATRLAGSADIFAAKAHPSRSINFATAHDGFTLADLVSFETKHNAANGEDNQDGTNANFSWNHGIEGPTADPAITEARTADQRALLALTLFARGTPMLAMGSELGFSQSGNNNAYAQDNETSWLDWSNADSALFDWTRTLLRLRAAHPTLRHDAFLTGTQVQHDTPPDVQWLRLDGTAMTVPDWQDQQLVMVLTLPGDRVALAINRTGTDHTLHLPHPQPGHAWTREAASRDATAPGTIAARGIELWAETPTPRHAAADPHLLEKLATAAGLASEWWETSGTHHRTAPDTARALLQAIGLQAGTTAEARDSLDHLTQTRDHRPLPHALMLRAGHPARLRLPWPPHHNPRPIRLHLATDAGETHSVTATPIARTDSTGPDGRPISHIEAALPDLPIGRHTLTRDDAPDHSCQLTVAPSHAYLPPALAEGQRRFGLSAQLYAMRRDADQGIGDLTALRQLASLTAAAGGAALVINPLHALFPTQRDRASPYQPSDRRFLDPIYLDVPEANFATDLLRPQGSVDYTRVWAAKAFVLEQRFQVLQGCKDVAAFRAEGGQALEDFAVFQAIAETHPGIPWQQWPPGLRRPGTPECKAFAAAHAERVAFHSFLQCLADRALAAASTGLEIGLIRDLAVGCAPDGAEAWALGPRIAHGVSIGAPPDPFSAEGQVWGLPAPNPLALLETGCADFISLLRANLRHAGGLRIDHALGLTRLFLVPDGAQASAGTYLTMPFEHLLGHIALESHQAQALIIGEDLGTVPDGLRERLASQNILATRVLLLERDEHGFKPAARYPRRAIASVSSHDLPTIAGWQQAADLTERRALGLAAAPPETRAAEIEALQSCIGQGDLATEAHRFIASTACDLVTIQAEDLACDPTSVNLPGTDQERPNWRRRISVKVDQLLDSEHAQALVSATRAVRMG